MLRQKQERAYFLKNFLIFSEEFLHIAVTEQDSKKKNNVRFIALMVPINDFLVSLSFAL